MIRQFTTFCLLMLGGIFLAPAQSLQSDSTRLQRYKEEAISLVRFLEFTLNTIGDPQTPAREKDIIIQDSYLKMFQSAEVQIEDDLVPGRSVVTNKEVQAYLKDVDFFFQQLHFEFADLVVEHQVKENGDLYFLVSFLRYLEGITIDGDTTRNSQERFVEINLDQESRVLKIASIYTMRLGEEEDLTNWWNGLDPFWRELWGQEVQVNDTLTLAQLARRYPTASLGDTLWVQRSPEEGSTYVGNLNVFDVNPTTSGAVPDTLNPSVLDRDSIPLYLGGPQVFAGLKQLVDRQALDLSGLPQIEDISALSKFAQLRSLDLSESAVFDLSPIRNLTRLEQLNLSHTPVRSVEPLYYATELRELRLAHSKVMDLQPLTRFQNLRTLDLSHTLVRDIRSLASLSTLADLDLSHTLVEDLTPLSELTNLTRLVLTHNWRIQHLEAIGQLAKLQYLNLESSSVQDLRPLTDCQSLRLLFVDSTSVGSLDPLLSLPALSRVYCDHSEVTQDEAIGFMRQRPDVLVVYESGLLRNWWQALPPAWQQVFREQVPGAGTPGREELQQMANLAKLDIRNRTNLRTLGPLEVLVNLSELDCAHTQVSDLGPLQDLPDLERLDASYTQVTDLQPLANLSRLRELRITHTPVKDLLPLAHLYSLEQLQADSTEIALLFPLDSLSRLRHLSLEGAPLPRLEARRFLMKHPDCLLLFESQHLLSWWAGLSAAWQQTLQRSAGLPADPDPEQLHRLTQQRRISLQEASSLYELMPMAVFLRLQQLQVEGSMVRDLSPLAELISLEVLLLAENPISDLTPLQGLYQLRHLQVDNSLVEDLEPLAGLQQLQVLSCKGTQIRRLDPLAYVTGLRQLDIANTDVRSLSPLEELPGLTWLQCYNTRISERRIQKFQEVQPTVEVIYY